MGPSLWFDDLPVVGALLPQEAAAKLREVGEHEIADQLDMVQDYSSQVFNMGDRVRRWPFQDRPWMHTAHAFGYLASPTENTDDPLPIRSVGNLPADPTLKHTRINLTLNRLRVASYPGGGTHRILLHFFAQNQMLDVTEDVHFNTTYRVQEGEHAGLQGYPIFIGLNVGGEGMSFRCRTINVSNDEDEAFLSFLESDIFKAGLKLASTAQPVIAPFSVLAFGLTKSIATRHRNVAVQDFDLGLDFSTIPMGARLAEGSYLAVQIPENQKVIWNWNDWVYHPNIAQVVKRSEPHQFIPYNYLIFSITRYKGP